jgi:hypothetical protein
MKVDKNDKIMVFPEYIILVLGQWSHAALWRRDIVMVSVRPSVTLCKNNSSETVKRNLFIFGKIVSLDM